MWERKKESKAKEQEKLGFQREKKKLHIHHHADQITGLSWGKKDAHERESALSMLHYSTFLSEIATLVKTDVGHISQS